jgi:hypothetical protein
MGLVKRTKDGIDILEHALRGVRSSESQAPSGAFQLEGGVLGTNSASDVRTLDDTPVEREVIVRLPDRRKSR